MWIINRPTPIHFEEMGIPLYDNIILLLLLISYCVGAIFGTPRDHFLFTWAWGAFSSFRVTDKVCSSVTRYCEAFLWGFFFLQDRITMTLDNFRPRSRVWASNLFFNIIFRSLDRRNPRSKVASETFYYGPSLQSVVYVFVSRVVVFETRLSEEKKANGNSCRL